MQRARSRPISSMQCEMDERRAVSSAIYAQNHAQVPLRGDINLLQKQYRLLCLPLLVLLSL